jgi:hypothetical protein
LDLRRPRESAGCCIAASKNYPLKIAWFVEGLDNNRILKPLLMQLLRKFFQLDELKGSKMFNLL